MTTQGVIVLSLMGVAYLLWILNLIRRRRLHVAYAVVWVFWIALGVVIVAIPPVLNGVTALVGAVFPASALSLLAFALLFTMQIYLLSQLSILSRRISMVAQHIALTGSAGNTPTPSVTTPQPDQSVASATPGV